MKLHAPRLPSLAVYGLASALLWLALALGAARAALHAVGGDDETGGWSGETVAEAAPAR